MSNNSRLLLGLLQIAGGVASLWTALMFDRSFLPWLSILIYMGIVSLHGILGLTAGLLTLKRHSKARILSIVFFGLQVPAIFSSAFCFDLISGLSVEMRFGRVAGFSWFWGGGGTFYVNGGHEFSLGLNLFALGILVHLVKNRLGSQDAAKNVGEVVE